MDVVVRLQQIPDRSFGGAVAVNEASRFRPGAEARALTIAVYAGCACLLLAQIAFNFVDIDIWHEMNLVRASVGAGRLIADDPFAYTPTVHPMIDHEWGAGALAFFLTTWMGAKGLLLLKFTAAFGALFLAMTLGRARGATASVLGFLAPLAIGLLYLGFLPAVRAHAYSFLFIAVLLWALELHRRGESRWLWVWLAIFPIWVNLHAGLIVGIGFVFLYGLEQALVRRSYRSVIFVFCGMVAEVFLTPYGTRYFPYLLRTLTMARPHIAEWGPVWTLGWRMTLAFAAAIGLALYALAKPEGAWRTAGVLLLAASGMEGLLHRKFLPFFAIVWLCYVPAEFQATAAGRWLQQFAQRRRRFLVLVWTITVAICLVAAVRQRVWEVAVPQDAGEASYPVGAVDYLAVQKFHGNLMVPFRSGAYVSWKLYPAVKVSVDSRYDVAYPKEWVERMFRFYDAGEGWRQTLYAYATDFVLVPQNSPVRPLIAKEGWTEVYVDAQFELYGRPGIQAPTIDRRAESFTGTFP